MSKISCGFFDAMAPKWDKIIEIKKDKIGHILDVAEIKEGDHVLDVGTGTGVLVPYMADRIGPEGKIDAVDISTAMLERANAKFGHLPNVRFMLADVEEDMLRDTYDCIMMYCMYPHLVTPYDTLEWLVKLNLNPGGKIVIAFPESKKGINGIHHHNDGSVHTNHLIDASLFQTELAVRNLRVDYMEDNENYYIVRITKDK